ncbi:MAG TPA: LLM class F420-dependent oxidoreductase [Polyangiaceae bacterium]|nr:LLM class F420-dependent oxidoreductase [Polyangiaceae bacterium]
MRLGLTAGYPGSQMSLDTNLVVRAESLGFDSVWTTEAYGSDAVVPLAFLAAKTSRIRLGSGIMQMPARTPAMTAMTAMTLDALSGGRFILGLGPSGPQVVEGWHGVPYGKPLTRTREYVAIVRKILAREAPLEFEGEHYQIPYRGPDATGLGKPLKSILHGRRDLPIYTASIGPAGVALSAEIADGLIPVWMSPERFDSFDAPLQKGFDKAGGGKGLAMFDLAPMVTVVVGDDVESCRMPVKAMLSLYIGGMGAKGKNFYNDYAKRLGYEEAAERIQELYLQGKKAEAVAAVPDRLVDEVALVGPKDRIRERVAAWKASRATTMILGTVQPEALELLAELCL